MKKVKCTYCGKHAAETLAMEIPLPDGSVVVICAECMVKAFDKALKG